VLSLIFRISWQIEPARLLLFVVFLMLGFVIRFLISFEVDMLSFWVYETTAFHYIKDAVVVDDQLSSVVSMYDKEATLTVRFASVPETPALPEGARLAKTEGTQCTILFDKSLVSAMEMLRILSAKQEIADFALKNAEIEEIIKKIYGQ
jgi:hypothetical protein